MRRYLEGSVRAREVLGDIIPVLIARWGDTAFADDT
jgi:hypothetical protein